MAPTPPRSPSLSAKKTAKKEPRTQKPVVEESPEVKAIQEAQAVKLRELTAISAMGDRLENFFRGGSYELLNQEILVPFEQEIVNTLKNPAFSIENKEQLYQFQAGLRVVNQIRERIERKIKAGLDARVQMVQLQQPSEDE